ncbi:MAG: sensor histidine kinase, partial [Prochlorococcus sp.]
MDIPRLGKLFGVRGARAIHKSAPYSIRRALERTSLMAVMLGYGLLLLFSVQLPAEQRRQSQIQALKYAKTILRESKDSILDTDPSSISRSSIDPLLLKRVLSDFSSFRLALWMHPKGFEEGLVMPDKISNALLLRSPALRYLEDNQLYSRFGPVLLSTDSDHYYLTKDQIRLHGNTWSLYL